MLEDDVVLERMKRASIALQCVGNVCIAHQRVRFVIAIGENRVYTKVGCKTGNLFGCHPVQKQQSSSGSVQAFADLGNGAMDELDAAISGRPVRAERIENRCVENEHAVDALRRPQCVIKRSVVGDAQIAAKPHQG
jgi:hypothetical protein